MFVYVYVCEKNLAHVPDSLRLKSSGGILRSRTVARSDATTVKRADKRTVFTSLDTVLARKVPVGFWSRLTSCRTARQKSDRDVRLYRRRKSRREHSFNESGTRGPWTAFLTGLLTWRLNSELFRTEGRSDRIRPNPLQSALIYPNQTQIRLYTLWLHTPAVFQCFRISMHPQPTGFQTPEPIKNANSF